MLFASTFQYLAQLYAEGGPTFQDGLDQTAFHEACRIVEEDEAEMQGLVAAQTRSDREYLEWWAARNPLAEEGDRLPAPAAGASNTPPRGTEKPAGWGWWRKNVDGQEKPAGIR